MQRCRASTALSPKLKSIDGSRPSLQHAPAARSAGSGRRGGKAGALRAAGHLRLVRRRCRMTTQRNRPPAAMAAMTNLYLLAFHHSLASRTLRDRLPACAGTFLATPAIRSSSSCCATRRRRTRQQDRTDKRRCLRRCPTPDGTICRARSLMLMGVCRTSSTATSVRSCTLRPCGGL